MTFQQERKRDRQLIAKVTPLFTRALGGDADCARIIENATYRTCVYDRLPKDTSMRTSVRSTLLAAYRTKVRQLVRNIQENVSLKTALLQGKLSPANLVHMNAQDLNPSAPHWIEQAKRREAMQQRKQAKDAERQHERQRAQQTQSSAKETCPKCHASDYEYRQIQSRSADEPMTIFYTCRQCGKQWKD